MKNNITSSQPAYSIVVAVLMIGFLLILTTGTLNLVLQEMQDGKGRQDYMKAYAGAEGALELALSNIKTHGYGYDDDSYVNVETFGSGAKKALLSYNFESNVNNYNAIVPPLGIDIIPLFSINILGSITPITGIKFDADSEILWNIITTTSGISGKGSFTQSDTIGEKLLDEGTNTISYNSQSIESILSGEDYLIIQNLTSIPLTYTLTGGGGGGGGGFTLPRAHIISSARVGKFKQNLKTTVDNTEFLGILRYSIYSGE